MKKESIFFLLLVLMTAGSCIKNKNPLFDGVSCTVHCYELTGWVTDSAAAVPLSNAEVKFYYKYNSGIFISRTDYLGKTTTNSAGQYRFLFDGSRYNYLNGYYYAEVFKGDFFAGPGYKNRVGIFDLDTTQYNLPFVQNFALFRPAIVKVRVTAPASAGFQIITVAYEYGRGGNGAAINGGRAIDTTMSWSTAGDLRTYVRADAVKNGTAVTIKDSITVTANGTGTIELKFN